MLKSIFLTGALLLSFWCNAQEYKKIDEVTREFYYDYSFQQDSTDLSSLRHQEMVLQIGKKHSKFMAVNKWIEDSLVRSVEGMDVAAGAHKILPQIMKARLRKFCMYNLYKNYPKPGNLRFIGSVSPKKTLQVDAPMVADWKIDTSRDTTIFGYSCTRAGCTFAGRTYIAWFSTEIPIPNGPYKFGGLPGLILQVGDSKGEHVFRLSKMKEYSKTKEMLYIHIPCDTATAPQFAKAMKASIAEMYKRFGGKSSPVQYQNPEQESRTLRNIRSWNNYIEKY